MENKYKKLVKNTAVFTAGSFASKVLSFIIVPLYTYVLSTEEYGQIDIFLTSVNFIVPIISLQIQESMIRFLIGKDTDENTIVSNCLLVYMLTVPASIISVIVYHLVFKEMILSVLFGLSVLTTSFNNIFAHYLRSTGRNVAFAVKGIIETITILSLNILFLVVLKLGVKGYLISMLLAQTVGCFFIVFSGGLICKLNFRNIDILYLKNMLKFSIPLIPNSLMWWIMSAGDKYIINWAMGDGANGLYSLSLKIPTIVSLMYSFFFQAWQMSAIEEDSSKDRKAFYEDVYLITNLFLILLTAFITMMVNPIFHIMDPKFMPSWEYVPLLVLATGFNCQATFFGVVYTTTKKTKNVFLTTALGAVVNLITNIILIRRLGLHGVAIGTCMGYFVISIIRGKDVKKEVGMDFDLLRTTISVVIILVQIYITIVTGYCGMFVFGLVSLSSLVFLYRHETQMAIGIIRKMLFGNKPII